MSDSITIPFDNLIPECLRHFGDEQAALEELNQSLLAIQFAMQSHDTQNLPDLIDAQRQRGESLHEVRKHRIVLRKRIAEAMNIDEQAVTFVAWAETLSPEGRSKILEARATLLGLIEESKRLSQTNMAVAAHGMHVLNEVQNVLTGDNGQSDRYSSAGETHETNAHLVYNTRF